MTSSFPLEPWQTLFPVQKIILKASYGIPLDDSELFTITDWRRENPRQFTEKTYLEYLYKEGRSNVCEVTQDCQYQETLLCMGLRSGKDYMASVVSSAEVQRLSGLRVGDHVPPMVGVVLVSTEVEGLRGVVGEVFKGTPRTCGMVSTSPGSWYLEAESKFSPRVKLGFSTGKRVFHSISNGLVVLDDLAFIEDARDLYNALAPTVSYVPGGKILMMSSPNGREFFHNHFKAGMTRKDTLCVRAPTWEVNPTIPGEVFKALHDRDPQQFFKDYGAEWGDE